MKRWSRLDWIILIIFAVLITLFYWRILTPNPADRQSFPPGDFSHQFWAFATLEVREISAGRLPLWNPYTFAGAPFWADVQAAVFYPPSLLTILLSAPWGFSLFALEIEAILHFWLAATFMYLFIRRLTHSRAAATIAALTFTFSGYLTGYPSQQLALLEADTWLPLILYFLHHATTPSLPPTSPLPSSPQSPTSPTPLSLRPPTPQSLAPQSPYSLLPTSYFLLLAGGAWGLTLLAGHPQSALIIAYLTTAYYLFLRLTPPKPAPPPTPLLPNPQSLAPRSPLPALSSLLLFLFTGLALAAIQFLPAAEYTLRSVRAAGTYNNMSGGFPITDAIQLLLPGQVSYYSPLYIGGVGLTLAIWSLLSPAGRHRHTIFWGLVAFITFLISLGGNTFLYSPLYLFTPGFSIFRGQERWAFATAFSLSVLTAYGFQALLTTKKIKVPCTPTPLLLRSSAPRSSQSPIRKLQSAILLLSLLLTFLFFFGLNDTGWNPASPFFNLLGAATLLLVLSALAWLLWHFAPRLPPGLLTVLTAALICFDLFTVNWQTNLYPQPPEWHTRMPAAVAAIKQDAAADPGQPYRVYNEFRLYDNYGVPFQIEDMWGASPLRPNRYDQFLAPPMPIEHAWALLNVKYVITWRQELFVPSTIIYQEPAEDGTTYVHRLDDVGPRAWLVTQAEIAGDPIILAKIAAPDFDAQHLALLEPGARPYITTLNQPDPQDASNATAAISHLTFASPQALSLQVTTGTPALLILSETHYPGWQAQIDGQPAPLLRADYILRAIPLPPGEHTVKLTFRPLSFTIGAIISLLTVIVITGLIIRSYLSGRKGNRHNQQI